MLGHLLANNLDLILEKSLVNCHARGLHSVMLIEKPEQTVRLFVTDEDHELWRNHPSTYQYGLSIGFHPHHCNVTLIPVTGYFTNWIVAPVIDATDSHPGLFNLGSFQYQSGITGKEINFKKCGDVEFGTTSLTSYFQGRHKAAEMKAEQLHTVYVEKDKIAAWLVLEGMENASHDGMCYSNADLETEDFSHLYKPMDLSFLMKILSDAGLFFCKD